MAARVPAEVYQLQSRLSEVFPHLRPAQRRGLAWWVIGTVWAHSACQSAVVTALVVWGSAHALRQRLREWLYDGADRAAPCATQVEVSMCFAPLLGWVLSYWQGRELALAVDATLQGTRVTALVVSVLYRGSAMPVAWVILPANQSGAWLSPILKLLRQLHPAVPRRLRVVVLADRGLWSPRLWKRIRDLGWHPLLRVQNHITFAPSGRERVVARTLVAPGQAWVGRGRLGAPSSRRGQRTVTLIAIWLVDQREPWVVVTDLAPSADCISWYALRMWIELGFRVLKSVGWQWQRTRRTDTERVARYWLVLAVATVWVMAYGTRVEDAQRRHCPPARLLTCPGPPPSGTSRTVSLFQVGLRFLQQTLRRGRLWKRLWLYDQPWPTPPPGVQITVHDTS